MLTLTYSYSQLGDQVVFPAAGFVCMALESATQIYELLFEDRQKIKSYDIQSMSIDTPLIIPEDSHGIEVVLSLHPSNLKSERGADSQHNFRVVSVVNSGNSDTFVEHAKGSISLAFAPAAQSDVDSTWPIGSSTRTPISAERWYDDFAQNGLNYRNSFQGLNDIKCRADDNVAEARVHLAPKGTDFANESPYVIHPAAIDTFLQLSIIAFHSGVASRLKNRFIPVSFEQIIVQPTQKQDIYEPVLLAAKSTAHGQRGFKSDLRVIGINQRVLVDIKGLQLIRSDHGSLTQTSEQNPYSRIAWQPSLCFLNTHEVETLFPPVEDHGKYIQRLNDLALHQLVQFHDTRPELFNKTQNTPHLQKLLDWILRKWNLAHHSRDPTVRMVVEYSLSERAAKIAQSSLALNEVSSESRLMCHIYQNLSAIFDGEISGIQVALQGNRLTQMYETGSIIAEGNRRLACIMELISFENSRLRILEVGAGTGSATREILPKLKGKTTHRRYKEYVYTDVSSSFLHKAKEEFEHYQGVVFSTYDMEEPASTQKIDSSYDVVLASNVSTADQLRNFLQYSRY